MSVDVDIPYNIKIAGIVVWVNIDDDNQAFRERALEVYKKSNQSDRLAVHWAMLLLAFPIFRDLCAIIGKLAESKCLDWKEWAVKLL